MTIDHAPFRRLLIATCTAGALFGAPHTASAEPFLNCVQFVKQASPVALSGDAYRWWEAANGVYGRGTQPKPGAVMVFSKSRHLPHGHVAIVDRQLDERTILVDHANWSRISGRRGHVEREARVVDVSPRNDWSRVKVWYHTLSDVGDSVYKLSGFVYPRSHHSR